MPDGRALGVVPAGIDGATVPREPGGPEPAAGDAAVDGVGVVPASPLQAATVIARAPVRMKPPSPQRACLLVAI
jgi:hypothetical protein